VALRSESEARVEEAAARIAADLAGSLPEGAELLGPAPMFRVRNRHRRRLLIKAEDREGMVEAVRAVVERRAADRSLRDVSIGVDVDPQ
jgi:primosomal protein N' (replication factor Y)